MNRLDNLPVDIIKIINRKVEDLHIQERRIERKKNRAENRLMKHKKEVKTKFIELAKRKNEKNKLSIMYHIKEKKQENQLRFLRLVSDLQDYNYFTRYNILKRKLDEKIENNISTKDELIKNFKYSILVSKYREISIENGNMDDSDDEYGFSDE